VRGPERSRSLVEVAEEVEALVADGVREVTLLGQNVNAYGLDLRRGEEASAPAFAELLRRLDAVEGLERIRFMTSHPKDLGDDLVAAVAELPSVCEHVHLPAQAGSDRILRAMRRGYSASQYLERVSALRTAVPDISITTDLIAGFPGETEQDFERTLDLVREAAFDAAFTFVYSPRSGTHAADLPDQVPPEVRRERVERLIELTQQQALAWRRQWVGRSAEVLVEGLSKDGTLHRGRTRQNVTVNVAGAVEPGAIVTVEIIAATSTTLRGTV
jgi:tRNA-2-methylthio-N6-dimethylallyladenosine synthase